MKYAHTFFFVRERSSKRASIKLKLGGAPFAYFCILIEMKEIRVGKPMDFVIGGSHD
jgi:hypothetical protein